MKFLGMDLTQLPDGTWMIVMPGPAADNSEKTIKPPGATDRAHKDAEDIVDLQEMFLEDSDLSEANAVISRFTLKK